MTVFARRIATALAQYDKIVIWGAGSFARTAMRNWLPRNRIVRIVDRNPSKQGQALFGLKIENPDEVEFDDTQCIVICVTAHLEVSAELDKRNVKAPRYYLFDLLTENDAGLSEWHNLAIDYQLLKHGNYFRTLIEQPQFWVNITYRLTRHFDTSGWLKPLHYLFRFFHAVVMTMVGIEIPHTVVAGPGLWFAHLGGLVIHDQARLGNFVTLYQFSTIGSNDTGHVPNIGNHVIIYSGACVLGRSQIGDYCRVGANSVVLDLESPAGATLVGAPARIVQRSPENSVA